MTTEELMNLAYEHLDLDRTRYPEPEMVMSGLNPAQDLIELMTRRLRHSHVIEVPRHSGFVNLLEVCPGFIRVERVLHGDQAADRVTPGQHGVDALEQTHVESLHGLRPNWWHQTGAPRRYYLHGRYLMGLWPRPMSTCTLTLVLSTLAEPLSHHDTAREPELRDVDHQLIADIAHCLLLVKEGAVEIDKAFGRMALLMRHEAFSKSLARIRKQSREWPRSHGISEPQTSIPTPIETPAGSR